MRILSHSKIFKLSLVFISSSQIFILMNAGLAKPPENCVPVARSLESRKTYCKHELKSFLQKKSTKRNAGILCFIVNKIFSLNQLLNIDQCILEDSSSGVDSRGERIAPKIKGASKKFAILHPIGKMVVSPQPEIAWEPIDNASYRVTLMQGGEWIWSHTTRRPSARIQYNLQPDKVYRINVALVNSESVGEASKALKLADPSLLRSIDQTMVQSHGKSSSKLAWGLDRALLLFHARLLDAAVLELKTLTHFQEAEVYRLLGLIYREAGQSAVASKYITKAEELANRKIKPSAIN